jgi:histidinol dehydrogenase
MRTLDFASKKFDSELALFCRGAAVPAAISRSVASILSGVRRGGDRAVARYALKFDGARLKPRQFRVRAGEIAAASRGLSPSGRRALRAVHAAVREFNAKTLPKGWRSTNRHGARVGEKFDAIRRVGIYVPGGQVPLVSTVLMTATLARIAGCREVAAFTPVGAGGAVAPELLAALDKIFGPGNVYVCEAKRQVFGAVGIDLLPGPSEVMVIADESARPDFAAADLLAQAEHGSGREKIYLVATSKRIIARVEAEIRRQLPGLSRSAKTKRVVDEGFLAILVKGLDQAADVANRVAPEHLELLVSRGAMAALEREITTAGAIMCGNWTPTVLGDFAAGPSHVLPTAGAGRFSSGLQVSDFLRRTSLLGYDARSLARAEPTVAALSSMERLDAHGRSATIRLERAARQ